MDSALENACFSAAHRLRSDRAMKPRFSIPAPVATMLRLTLAITTFLLAARTAHADDPAHVRVRLHPRADGATFVDIAVTGTESPIRLVRRVAGTCVLDEQLADGAVAAITCDGGVRFEVRRERSDVTVRRTTPEPDATDPWTVMARTTITRDAALVLDAPAAPARVAARQ